MLDHVYPETKRCTSDWNRIVEEFHEIWGLDGDPSWLPLLLQNLEEPVAAIEQAQVERARWVIPSLADAPLRSSRFLKVHPTLQMVRIQNIKLPGIYAFWWNQGSVREEMLSQVQLQILDLLQEDIAWSPESLEQHLQEQSQIHNSGAELRRLLDLGLVCL